MPGIGHTFLGWITSVTWTLALDAKLRKAEMA